MLMRSYSKLSTINWVYMSVLENGSIAANLYDVPSATFSADFESTCVETNIVFGKI